MKSVKFLEQVKAQYGLKNDRQLATHLNMTSGTISQYMSGKRIMDDEACLAVALQLDINPLQVIGAACIDRAEKTGQKSLWEVFMSRTAATAAAVLVASGVNLFLTPESANAATMRVPATVDSSFYRLCAVALPPGLVTKNQQYAQALRSNVVRFSEVNLLDRPAHIFLTNSLPTCAAVPELSQLI